MRGRRRKDRDGKVHLPILRDFTALETFVAVMETHSISKAASRLNTVPSAVSQRLAKIEDLAQTKLFNRTTRIVSPTEAAFSLYGHCNDIIRRIDEAEQDLWNASSMMSGELRIAAPVYFGTTAIAPILPEFARRYPDIVVSMQLSAQEKDLISEGFDLAIRFQSNVDPRNGEVLLFENDRVFCASPAYIAANGTPRTPDDLRDHACICNASATPFIHWEYLENGQSKHTRVDPALKTDNVQVMIEATRQAFGISLLGRRAIVDWLANGEIVTVLEDFSPISNFLVATTPDRNFMPEKAKAFMAYLKEHLGVPAE